jgi:hypothetical protein
MLLRQFGRTTALARERRYIQKVTGRQKVLRTAVNCTPCNVVP